MREIIAQAYADKTPLKLCGSGSKHFLGQPSDGIVLSTLEHQGIIDYQPSELFIKAHAGTRLHEIEQLLTDNHQILPFEPPHFGTQATLGGTIACGLSGPARPWRGAARDFVLGCRIINGKAEVLQFGGEVIKNVAGYDVSRLMTGAFGTMGLLLDLSIKTIPRPAMQITLTQEKDKQTALSTFSAWRSQPLPITAAAWWQERLYLRLSGASASVQQAAKQLGGDELPAGDEFWQQLKEQQLDFFRQHKALWRLSLPIATGPLDMPGEELIDWGGAQRWLHSDADASEIRQLAQSAGGHAMAYSPCDTLFQPLAPALWQLHKRLKQAFDPANILNPGRMYQDL